MTYMTIEFQPMAQLKLVSKEGQIVTTEDLSVNEANWFEEMDHLINQIKELEWTYSGMAIDLIRTELTDQEKTALLALGESLNCPVILLTEHNGPKEILDQLKEEADQRSWTLDYYGYTPGKTEYSVESLLTTGNGFVGLRGTLPEMTITDSHYPATYIAGLYNGAPSVIEGQTVINEDFVNAPNLQYIGIQIGQESPIEINKETVQSLHRHLDLKTGVFTSEAIVMSQGRCLKITSKRLVNMADKHHYSISYEVTPLNFSGELKMIAKSDAGVINYNVERYRSLENRHLDVNHLLVDGVKTTVAVTTKQSKIQVIQQSELFYDSHLGEALINDVSESAITQSIAFQGEMGQTYTLEKSVSVAYFFQEELAASQNYLGHPISPKPFVVNQEESAEAWRKLWDKADVSVVGDLMSQKLLRLHTYHLLVSGSPIANQELDVSITARGLHGEAYRGHIFWDEIFILPFYQLHFPEMAKQLLMYRYHRLGAAKENAREAGYSGAMFPWQSGLVGTEQTQEVHLNPLNGEWGEDYSRLQRHVSLAIAYNVWNYWHNTGDQKFMSQYGSEMLLEIAEFWRSKTVWDEGLKRYSIPKVMGPDEFHEAYPDSQEGGLTDNAYTNLMVVWLFEEVANLVASFPKEELVELQRKTAVSTEKLEQMKRIGQQLHLEINQEGIIAQYAGYFELKEIDWDFYREKYGNVYRMDRILKANGESADDYKVAKQADTLMTFYNLSKVKVDEIISELGYELPSDYLEKNLNYYLERTSHGSTLSRIVHAQLAEMVDNRDLSWQLYQEALRSDYQDIQGGTTAEGIHTGVMAATLMVTLQTYGGVDSREELLSLNPDLPNSWEELNFNLTRRSVEFQVKLTKTMIKIVASQASSVQVGQEVYTLEAQQEKIIHY